MVDPLGVEQGGAPLDAVDYIALIEKKFGQISAVLAGDPCDQSDFRFIHALFDALRCSRRIAASARIISRNPGFPPKRLKA